MTRCGPAPLGEELQPAGFRGVALGEALAPCSAVRHQALVLFLAAGCATDAPEPEGYAADLGTPENPVPSTGTYRVTTRIQIPLGVPDVADAIAELRAFSANGGRTLLARSAGTPARLALDSLPSSLKNGLAGWIDFELDKVKFQTLTLRQTAAQVATIAETVTGEFTLESSLSITPTGASHSLRDLNFTPLALDIIIPVGGLNADKIRQSTTATVGAAGDLELGDQKFGLAFGSHAWQAINLASTQLHGGDLSSIQNINCEAVAQKVAARCVSGSCVGHTAEIRTICQQGMTSLIGDLRDELGPVALSTFRFVHGDARLVDTSGDGVADKIVDGTWSAETDAGMGVRMTSVAFSALE